MGKEKENSNQCARRGARPTDAILPSEDCDRPRLRNREQLPIERLRFFMGLVVKTYESGTVAASRAVDAPRPTNHELTQGSRGMICGSGGRQPLRETDC